MTTARTQTILALERVIAESKVLLDKAISLNNLVREKRLPIPPLELPAIWTLQQRAEVMLLEMELRAGVTA